MGASRAYYGQRCTCGEIVFAIPDCWDHCCLYLLFPIPL